MICKAKVEHWAEWLEDIDGSSIWDGSKLLTLPATDAGKYRIPMLLVKDPETKNIIQEAADNISKGKLFYNISFPLPNLMLTPVPENPIYPPPRWAFTNITDKQIHQVIKKMKPHKASKRIWYQTQYSYMQEKTLYHIYGHFSEP